MTRKESEEAAWTEVMKLAERHTLIVQAHGGMAVLLHPEEQRKTGMRVRTLMMNRGLSHKDAAAAAADEIEEDE